MVSPESLELGLRYAGYRQRHEGARSPHYFVGSVDLKVGTCFAIPPEGAVLGRREDADIRLTSNTVDPAHARIRCHEDGESLVAQDLDSASGISSDRGNDGALILLGLGDTLTIGGRFDFEVVVLSPDGDAA